MVLKVSNKWKSTTWGGGGSPQAPVNVKRCFPEQILFVYLLNALYVNAFLWIYIKVLSHCANPTEHARVWHSNQSQKQLKLFTRVLNIEWVLTMISWYVKTYSA